MKRRLIAGVMSALIAGGALVAVPANAGAIKDYIRCNSVGPERVALYGKKEKASEVMTMQLGGRTYYKKSGEYKAYKITPGKRGNWYIESATLLLRESGATCHGQMD